MNDAHFASTSPRLGSVAEQLATLAALEPGWHDGEGAAYDPERLVWLSERLGAVLSQHAVPPPYVYPAPDGSVALEWSGEAWEVAVTVDLETREAWLLAAKVDSRATDEGRVALDSPGADGELGRFLREHLRS